MKLHFDLNFFLVNIILYVFNLFEVFTTTHETDLFIGVGIDKAIDEGNVLWYNSRCFHSLQNWMIKLLFVDWFTLEILYLRCLIVLLHLFMIIFLCVYSSTSHLFKKSSSCWIMIDIIFLSWVIRSLCFVWVGMTFMCFIVW